MAARRRVMGAELRRVSLPPPPRRHRRTTEKKHPQHTALYVLTKTALHCGVRTQQVVRERGFSCTREMADENTNLGIKIHC